jgi:decaprenylphospho-beta-D-ribofuranose 2-oxidase
LLFSELWYRKAPKLREGQLVSIPSFFHPLDGVGHWNRLYGKKGLVQHQCVVPLDRDDVIRSILQRVSSDRPANVVNVLKRFGEGNNAHLSFPQPGWTLTVDLPVTSQLSTTLADIDAMVLSAGGRHYLAKDATTGSLSIRSGYPRLGEWQHIRHRVDPNQRWQSDLSRRLNLCATLKDSE